MTARETSPQRSMTNNPAEVITEELMEAHSATKELHSTVTRGSGKEL